MPALNLTRIRPGLCRDETTGIEVERVTEVIGALGTATDEALTLAVAAAMTPEQRREWRDGSNAMRTGHGFGPDLDAEWLADLIDDAYPDED